MHPRIVDWIALSMLPGLGPILIRRLLERFGDPGEIAFRLPPRALASVARFPGKLLTSLSVERRDLERRAQRELERCRRLGIRVLARCDPDYPAALESLDDRPPVLYQRGALPTGVLRVAVIGSRSPTAYGRRVATGLAGGLAARGIEVVSGGARGIDSLAHRGALEEGGRTVAVLGSGLLRPFPPENGQLFEEIAGSGALLTEFGLEMAARTENFPRRNRLISGLSAAVVVVEAAVRSGSLITAGHAADQGREVLAVPGPVSSAKSRGCHALIQQGAKLVQNIEDILDELPPIFRQAAGPSPPSGRGSGGWRVDDLVPDELEIVRILDETEARHIDELAERALLGIARLQAALLGLEIRGAVEQLPGRYYLLRPPTVGTDEG